MQELKASLDKQFAQSNRLCVALKHEQTAKDNLQKELRIEASRCEALLAQERGRLTELQQSLEAERGRAQELTEALQHERLLTEQLSRRAQEVCAHQETQAQQALLQKLEEEQARVRELQAMLQKAQQQAVRTQQRLQAEVQRRCAELQREKEVSAVLRAAVEAQQPEPPGPLQTVQAELEQLHGRRRERQGRRPPHSHAPPSPGDSDKWQQWQRDKEKLVRATAHARGPPWAVAVTGLVVNFRPEAAEPQSLAPG